MVKLHNANKVVAHAGDDLLEFAEPAVVLPGGIALSPWRVLIVDDDDDVHRATELALRGLTLEGRGTEFLHAYSGQEARDLMLAVAGVAVVLLDVVMESEDAGLQLARWIRQDLRQNAVRIVLRTGQPGYAPEIDTVRAFDINDYKTKSELTRTRLFTTLTTALRSHKQILSLEQARAGLAIIVDASTALNRMRSLDSFADSMLRQLERVLDQPAVGLVCAQGDDEAISAWQVVAATGKQAGGIGQRLGTLPTLQRERLMACVAKRDLCLFEDSGEGCGLALFFGLRKGRALLVNLDLQRLPSEVEQALLRAFAANILVGFENVILGAQLLDQAFNDPLLHLPNRARFIELLERNLQAPEGICLALIDIDDFSDINDAFGHQFGDQVLRAVAARLSERMGRNTSMARIAADTFGLLGPDGLVNQAAVQRVFEDPFAVEGERLQLSATTGMVRLSASSPIGSELLLDAQIALKRGKQQHRGGSQYFSPEMGTDARARFKLLKGLRAAFEENRLFVTYQPQVELGSRRVLGAEALLRWRTAEGKFVPPDQFIPLAEQSGLIIPIGDFVLRTSCEQLKRMAALGHKDFRMCVNISLAQFRHVGFIDALQSALRDTGVDPRCLELEITESMAMEDASMVLQVLGEIKRTGATVAIDDFGTGFSSLSQLRRLEVERLKIDRAFVIEAENSDAGSTIAQMVVSLGLGLGLRVIAEGIETEEQHQRLLGMGCHEGQGWLFARAMEAAALEQWMASERAGQSH